MISIDAIILAGGKASRMGGPDKVMLELEGRKLVERAVDAALTAGCESVAVVGPRRELCVADPVRIAYVQEDPPFSGPVAALNAARDVGHAEWVLLLAADLPRVAGVVSLLGQAIAADPEVPAHLIKAADGHLEWLCSAMRREEFEKALDRVPHLQVGVRRLFDGLIAEVHLDPDGLTDDVDTPEMWEQAQQRGL
ncbi:MAG: molybdenum cofactor guanylyltransferase [Aeromicrobium sp.]|nr:MAG: molybdenum cofactor guanylyltransferase [Aeromicrobium sp.]